ncbi:MAG: GspE/PulE family protein [bacterium]|nr:GspE/PulE family protein [bacterium]
MDDQILFQELIKENLLPKEESEKILRDAQLSKKSAEDLLYEHHSVDETEIAKVKSRLIGVPYKKFNLTEISDELLNIIPENISRTYKVFPLEKTKDMLVVGMLRPDDTKAQEALKFIAKQQRISLGVYLITPSDLEYIWRRYAPYGSEVQTAVRSLNLRAEETSGQKIIGLEENVSVSEEAPIIKIVASTLKEAINMKASDVHIEPQRSRLRIRFRIDGILKEVSSLPLQLHQPIVSRVKVLSNLKIDENRIPQDGRFRSVVYGKEIDYRVATFPTPTGEKVAIRILDSSVGLKGLGELGLIGNDLEIVREGIKKPYGMILITGPTGSGKTTTLYAVLQELNKEDVNIVSLEDPVEYFVDGLNQSQVRPEIGYDFASGLRQIVRQDPDVIMVGEIRDRETSSLAVQAALTGHIVLSTLHTNDAIGVIPRLIDLKVEPFLLPSSLNLMLAQRLISRVCPDCRKAEKASADVQVIIKKELGSLPEKVKSNLKFKEPYEIYHGQGCKNCQNRGLNGRVAIFEVFRMTPELADIIGAGFTERNLLEESRRQNMITIRQDGIIKALEGLVTIEEVLRETIEV